MQTSIKKKGDMISNWFKEILDQFVTQEMCNEAVQRNPWMLEFVPDQYKTQEMCNEVVQNDPWVLKHVPDQFVTQEMCNEAVKSEPDPEMLEFVPDQYKTQEMCNEAIQSEPEILEFVPDYFVTQEMEEFIDDDELITWYKQRKAQKAQIKEELMPVAWHPDRWWDWCVPEDEKKELENIFT